jgi:hypothetical protein
MNKKALFKYALFCLLLLTHRSLLAQSIVSQPEYHFLYAHYENVVEIGGSTGMSQLTYKIQHAESKEDKENNRLIIIPNEGATEVIFSFFNKADQTLVNEVKYAIRELPKPELLFTYGQQALKVGYGPEIPINASKLRFTVTDWKVSLIGSEQKPLTGKGPVLSPEVISLIMRAPKGTTFFIEARYEGAGVKDGLLIKEYMKEASQENPGDLDEFGNQIETEQVVEKEYLISEGIVGLPELSILYKNYENIVQIGSVKGEVQQVSAENAVIKKSRQNKYLITPSGDAKMVELRVKTSSGENVHLFKVMALPKPTLFINNLDKLSLNTSENHQITMTVGYPPYVPLDLPYTITKWYISYGSGNKPFVGIGNTFPKALVDELKKQKDHRQISVECTYKGNGLSSIVSSVFSY